MPGPAGYAVGAAVVIVGVATAYVVKKHVWDPHVQPKVDQWVEEMKMRARAHRDRVRQHRQGRTPIGVPIFSAEQGALGEGPVSKKDDAPEVEMTHVGTSSSAAAGFGGAGDSGLRNRIHGRHEMNEPNPQLPTPPMAPTPVRSPAPSVARTTSPFVHRMDRSLPPSPRVQSPVPAPRSSQPPPAVPASMNPFDSLRAEDRPRSPATPSVVPSSPTASSISILSSFDGDDEEAFLNADASQVLSGSRTGSFHTASDGIGPLGLGSHHGGTGTSASGARSPYSHASVYQSATTSPALGTDAVLLSPMIRPGSALSDDSGYQWVSPSIPNSPRM